jgi:hypothetical protein
VFTSKHNIYIYIHIYIYTHTHTYVCIYNEKYIGKCGIEVTESRVLESRTLFQRVVTNELTSSDYNKIMIHV